MPMYTAECFYSRTIEDIEADDESRAMDIALERMAEDLDETSIEIFEQQEGEP